MRIEEPIPYGAAAPRAVLEAEADGFIAPVTQSSMVFTSVAQELTEEPFWRQHGMGKGDHLGTNYSPAICRLCDFRLSLLAYKM